VTETLKEFTKKHLLVIGIFCLGFFTYAPSLNNQLFWDDEQFIYNNQYVIEFNVQKIFTTNTLAGAGESSNYYRPLTTLSFAMDHAIWGLNPIGFHLTNTLLHSLAGVLLFLLLLSLSMNKKAAAVIAGFFLIHPLQTEAVVYANSRGDSHFTFYMLLGLLCFSALLQEKKYTWQIYNVSATLTPVIFAILVPLFFIASVLAKEIAVGSLLLYLLLFFFLRNTTQTKKTLRLGLLTLTSVFISLGIYVSLRATTLLFQEQVNMFEGSAYGDSIFVRIATFAKVFLIYISLIFVPVNLHMERTTEIVTSLLSPYTFLSVLLIGTITFIGFQEKKKTKSNWIHFGLLWFLIMLLPVSGLVPINDIMYEHWLYVPLIGFLIMLYGLLQLLVHTLHISWPKYTKQALSILATICILLTLRQNFIWGRATRFYPYILQYQETARIHNNLAMAYADENKLSDAITHYKRAIEIADTYPQTHHNLARAYQAQGNNEMAFQEFSTALSMNPNFLVSYPNLIQLLISEQKYDLAEEYLTTLEKKAPASTVVQQLKRLLDLSRKDATTPVISK